MRYVLPRPWDPRIHVVPQRGARCHILSRGPNRLRRPAIAQACCSLTMHFLTTGRVEAERLEDQNAQSTCILEANWNSADSPN